jgi:hypothetical protein
VDVAGGCPLNVPATSTPELPIGIGNRESRGRCGHCGRANSLLAYLKGRGVKVWATPEGKVRYSPKGALSTEEVEGVREHKEPLLSLLSRKRFQCPQCPQRPLPEQKPDRYGGNAECTSSHNVHTTSTTEHPTSTTEPPSGTSNVPEIMREAERAAKAKAEELGLVARWSSEFGFISIHDPTAGEWHDLPTKDAPDWAKRECFKRRELRKYKGITRLLNRAEMEEVWREEEAEMWEHPAVDKRGLVYEDYLAEE